MNRYLLRVDDARTPKGQMIEVPPFGAVENGGPGVLVLMADADAEVYGRSPTLSIEKTTKGDKTQPTTELGGVPRLLDQVLAMEKPPVLDDTSTAGESEPVPASQSGPAPTPIDDGGEG